nr:hypothetical protein [Arthrobacter sp. fls2-241-R2A-200]
MDGRHPVRLGPLDEGVEKLIPEPAAAGFLGNEDGVLDDAAVDRP